MSISYIYRVTREVRIIKTIRIVKDEYFVYVMKNLERYKILHLVTEIR